MKKFLLLSAVLAAALSASAHDYTTSLSPATAAISTTNASSYAGTGGGMSISGAYNHQTAATGGVSGGMAGAVGPLRATAVNVTGNAATTGISAAGNLSVGNASGSAGASGMSTASVVGAGSGHTVSGGPLASVSGNAEAVTGTAASTGSNGLGVSAGGATSAFSAGASASQIKVGPFQTVDVQSHALTSALTTPSVQIQMGSATVSIQNEAAANAFGQAKVGAIASTSN